MLKVYKSVFKETTDMTNPTIKYTATVFADTEVDSYDNGLTGETGTSWNQKFEDKSLSKLLDKVRAHVGADKISDLDSEQINDYEWGTELHYDKTVNEDNYDASPKEIELWKQGQKKLWLARYHVIVSKIVMSPIDETELKAAGIR